MHVLIIPSWYPADATDVGGSFFREQAQALVREGCKVGVIHPQLRSLRRWRTALTGPRGVSYELDGGVHTYRFHGINWFPKLHALKRKYWLASGRRLYDRYVREQGKPDLVHVHSLLEAGCLAARLADRKGLPYVVTEHSTTFARGLVEGRALRMARQAAGGAMKRYAVSAEFCSLLERQLNPGGGGWSVIPNIVNHKFLDAVLEQTRFTGKRFTFIHISLLDKKKAVDNALRAFAGAFRGNSNVLFKIGGDGAEKAHLVSLAVHLGIAEQVIFLGMLSRDDVLQQVSSSQAFVLSSRHETFGVVLVEALALGKPVIATRCGGPESIVQPQDGLLVPVDDTDALATAMRCIHRDYAKYDAAAIRASCERRFSGHAVMQRLLHEYQSILAGKGTA